VGSEHQVTISAVSGEKRDGSIALEFMTDDASEAQELRDQMLAFDCVAEVVVDEPDWVST